MYLNKDKFYLGTNILLWTIVATLLLTFYVTPTFDYCSALLSYPFDWDLYEGFTLFAANSIRAGHSPYTDALLAPFTSYAYPPLYPSLIALLGSGDVSDIFLARGISIASLFLLLWTIYLVGRALELPKQIALLAVLLPLSIVDIATWSALARVDLLHTALAFSSVVCLHRSRFKAALLLLTLATATKHSTLPLLAIVVVLGFWKKELRKTTLLYLLSIALLSNAWLLFVGDEIVFSLARTHVSQLRLDRVLTFLKVSFIQYPLLFLGALGLGWIAKQFRDFPWVALFCLYSFGFLLLTGHIGSAGNYMIWPVAALSLGLFYFAAKMEIPHLKPVLLAQVLMILHLLTAQEGFVLRTPDAEAKQVSQSIVDLLRVSSDPALVDDYPLWGMHAGFAPLAEMETTRTRIWLRYGEEAWKKHLLEMFQSQTKPNLILAGSRLGALYPELMRGMIPAGRVFVPNGNGREDFAAFVTPELLPTIEPLCRKRDLEPFYCLYLRDAK